MKVFVVAVFVRGHVGATQQGESSAKYWNSRPTTWKEEKMVNKTTKGPSPTRG